VFRLSADIRRLGSAASLEGSRTNNIHNFRLAARNWKQTDNQNKKKTKSPERTYRFHSLQSILSAMISAKIHFLALSWVSSLSKGTSQTDNVY
jgi:hypothetical protein